MSLLKDSFFHIWDLLSARVYSEAFPSFLTLGPSKSSLVHSSALQIFSTCFSDGNFGFLLFNNAVAVDGDLPRIFARCFAFSDAVLPSIFSLRNCAECKEL